MYFQSEIKLQNLVLNSGMTSTFKKTNRDAINRASWIRGNNATYEVFFVAKMNDEVALLYKSFAIPSIYHSFCKKL